MAENSTSGWVYCLSNPRSFCGVDIFLVGMSRTKVKDKIEKLNSAVPFPFIIYKVIYTERARAFEKAMHYQMIQYRMNTEATTSGFFRLALPELDAAIEVAKSEIGGVEVDIDDLYPEV